MKLQTKFIIRCPFFNFIGKEDRHDHQTSLKPRYSTDEEYGVLYFERQPNQYPETKAGGRRTEVRRQGKMQRNPITVSRAEGEKMRR
jgi:cell division protein FtsI/penicillin-binding protein 2